ncbi:WYL domain-containing protein [uncultured Gammaproteobacteria bacterium]
MSGQARSLRWGIEQRLEFIEFRLFWEGGVNRGDIIEAFDVSVPQASKDLTLYQEQAPENAIYDKSAKRYVAGERFQPRFLKPDPHNYLSRLRSVSEGLVDLSSSWISELPSIDIALSPKRDIAPAVLRALLAAVRDGRSIDVLYQSMSKLRPEPMWRRVTPHAFGFDGFRWHTRAFCHLDNRFKDFLLPRVLEVGAVATPGASGTDDQLWQTSFDVVICPHPALTDSQKVVVAKDYGMDDGHGVLWVRYAMLFYVLKRLGLLGDAAQEDSRRQHIVVKNFEETKAALLKAGFPG